MGIRSKVSLGVSLLFGLLLCAVTALLGRLGEESLKEDVALQQVALVKTLAHGFDQQVDARHQALITVARALPVDVLGDRARLQVFLDAQVVLPSLFTNVLVYDPQGQVIGATPSPERYLGSRRLADQDYIRATRESGKPKISKLFVSPVSGEPLIVMTAPVVDAEGHVRAILGGSQYILHDNLFSGFTAPGVGRTGSMVLMTRERVVIAHTDKKRLMETIPPGANAAVDAALAGSSFAGESVSSHGVRGLFTLETMKTTGWLAGAVMPLTEAYEPILALRRDALRALATLLLVLPVLVWFAMGYLTRPLLELTTRITAMATSSRAGALLDLDRTDEIGALGHAFDALTRARRTSEEERVKLEEQLRHAQKLEALGRLAGGIAHDFNNLLSVIVGNAELVRAQLRPYDPSREDVAEILRAAERATVLSRSLLTFSRKQPAALKPISVNDLVRGLQKMVLRLIGADVETRIELASKPLVVMGDAGQLEQVLTNLATNARDAMPDGGTLRVETRRAEVDESFVREHGIGGVGRYAEIVVADTGVGMAEEVQARIFEPFFTTKGVDRGTGLGLSIVYGIVKEHGGFLECRSSPGAGTTFTLYLPLVERSEANAEATPVSAPGRRGSETVLVAEDDASIRKLFRRVLEGQGYAVVDVGDGVEAVRAFEAAPERFDLVILDGMMPRLSGPLALAEMRRIRPDVRVLLVTGYVEGLSAGPRAMDGRDVLRKPVTPDDLLARVREALDGESRPDAS
jgi:signal transduction histidine kinase/ActR/RegA family two-component response regulator